MSNPLMEWTIYLVTLAFGVQIAFTLMFQIVYNRIPIETAFFRHKRTLDVIPWCRPSNVAGDDEDAIRAKDTKPQPKTAAKK